MRLSKKFIVQFHKTIFEWWQENKRDLPWRHTHDPYKILLSEVMLQQTQVPRVLSVYTEFLKKVSDGCRFSKCVDGRCTPCMERDGV